MTMTADVLHAILATETDLDGELEPTGPRIGADRGEPQTASRILHASADGSTQVGIWECTPGGWAIVDRTDTEIVRIVRGRARITDADGTIHDLGRGDTLVFPLGWSGRWDISETIRKVFVTIAG
jgi:uncharacterized cupin superfamily protein